MDETAPAKYDYMRDTWPKVVNRRYDADGWMVALNDGDIVVDGVTVHIEIGQRLSREEALAFRDSVSHEWRVKADGPLDALDVIKQISAQVEALG